MIDSSLQGRTLNHNVGAGVIVSNHSLVLQGVGRRTAGNYTCVGFNTEGDGESLPFHLNVMCKYPLYHKTNIKVLKKNAESVKKPIKIRSRKKSVN